MKRYKKIIILCLILNLLVACSKNDNKEKIRPQSTEDVKKVKSEENILYTGLSYIINLYEWQEETENGI